MPARASGSEHSGVDEDVSSHGHGHRINSNTSGGNWGGWKKISVKLSSRGGAGGGTGGGGDGEEGETAFITVPRFHLTINDDARTSHEPVSSTSSLALPPPPPLPSKLSPTSSIKPLPTPPVSHPVIVAPKPKRPPLLRRNPPPPLSPSFAPRNPFESSLLARTAPPPRPFPSPLFRLSAVATSFAPIASSTIQPFRSSSLASPAFNPLAPAWSPAKTFSFFPPQPVPESTVAVPVGIEASKLKREERTSFISLSPASSGTVTPLGAIDTTGEETEEVDEDAEAADLDSVEWLSTKKTHRRVTKPPPVSPQVIEYTKAFRDLFTTDSSSSSGSRNIDGAEAEDEECTGYFKVVVETLPTLIPILPQLKKKIQVVKEVVKAVEPTVVLGPKKVETSIPQLRLPRRRQTISSPSPSSSPSLSSSATAFDFSPAPDLAFESFEDLFLKSGTTTGVKRNRSQTLESRSLQHHSAVLVDDVSSVHSVEGVLGEIGEIITSDQVKEIVVREGGEKLVTSKTAVVEVQSGEVKVTESAKEEVVDTVVPVVEKVRSVKRQVSSELDLQEFGPPVAAVQSVRTEIKRAGFQRIVRGKEVTLRVKVVEEYDSTSISSISSSTTSAPTSATSISHSIASPTHITSPLLHSVSKTRYPSRSRLLSDSSQLDATPTKPRTATTTDFNDLLLGRTIRRSGSSKRIVSSYLEKYKSPPSPPPPLPPFSAAIPFLTSDDEYERIFRRGSIRHDASSDLSEIDVDANLIALGLKNGITKRVVRRKKSNSSVISLGYDAEKKERERSGIEGMKLVSSRRELTVRSSFPSFPSSLSVA